MKSIDVCIGQVKLAKNGEQLKAIMGSCVAIGIIWRSEKKCALAHCLLPKGPDANFQIGARYVDQAVRSLVAMMKLKPENYNEVEVVIAGGGNMTASHIKEAQGLVGSANYSMAKDEIKKLGLKIAHAEGGGDVGRRIRIDTENFTFQVEKIPRLEEVG